MEERQPPLLGLEPLTEWLAKRVGMEYLHIDPLKIDFAGVTDVMSSAYATRFRILPVAVSDKEAVIATAEPHVREWEAEISRIIKRDDPARDRQPARHRALPGRVLQPGEVGEGREQASAGASGCRISSSWSSSASRDKPLDANDAHIVRIVDWLLLIARENVAPIRELLCNRSSHARR